MYKKYYEERSISIYKNFNTGLGEYNQKPFYKKSNTLTIKQIYDVIKCGGGVHQVQDIKPAIKYIQTHSKAESIYTKLNLPSFTVSADFESQRSKTAEKEYTQLIGFDFDKLTTAQVNEAITKLEEWDFTVLLFRSPSGKGLKLFIKVDSTEKQHEIVYRCFELYFKDIFGLELDMQCIDYTRLCYFSYDPSAYYNDNAALVTTKELIEKYKDVVKESSNGSEVDIINYDSVNTDSIKTVFYSFVNQLQANGIDWISGKRNKFLLEICKVKRYGINFNECLTELLTFIDGRYTSEYTAKNLPDKLAYNWKRYHNNYEIVKPKPANSLQIVNYLTEQSEFIKAELLEKRILFIDAPTGAGKTTLIKQLAKELNLKTDILMPTTALVEQQKDIATVTGRKALSFEMLNADVLACCYNSINKIVERNSKLLVIDEAHSLVSDYGFKSDAIQDIQRSLNRYEYVIYLSGSILTLERYYTADNLLSFNKKNRFNYEYQTVKLDERVTDNDYFINSLETGKLNVFYQNDKTVLDKLYIYLTDSGYKVAYISKDKKDNPEYKGIVENSSLNGYDVLLTTCIIQAGVNINECDRDITVTFGRRSNLIDYIQFTARFRTNKPAIKIIHSGKIGQLYLTDNEELLNRIEVEKQLLEKAQKINQRRQVDFNFLDADKIVKGLDLVMQDNEGNYTVDSFSLLFNHYQTLNQNIRSNIRILKHYLSLYNFTEVTSNSVAVDEEETKKLKKIGRSYSKEKKAKIDMLIDNIFNGAHIFSQATDKVTKDIEYKYGYLSQYLPDSKIKERRKLLTSNAAFDLYKSRVTYMLAESDIKAQRQVSDNVLLDYQRLKHLEKHIQVNTTYSSKELKDIIAKCGYTTTTNRYVTNSLGIIFEYATSKDGVRYTITGKINRCDYIVSKSTELNTDIDSLF